MRCATLVVCLIATLALAWTELTRTPQTVAADRSQNNELLQQTQELVQTVHGLEALRAASAAPDLEALFMIQPRLAAAPERPAPRPAPQYTVDMIIAAGKQGRAILSGRLTRINDILPDGSRVADIQADSVLLEHKGQTRRLSAPRGRIIAVE